MKRILAILCVIAMLMSVASACGKDDIQDNKEGNTANKGKDENVQKRDDLVVILNNKISNYDPFAASLIESFWLNGAIFDTLLEYDGTGKLELLLAESYEVSDDGMEWTFKIHDNVLFHNGSKLTSEDVKFSFEKAIESPYIGANLNMIESIDVIDELTLKMNMKYYFADTLNYFYSVYIVPKAEYETLGQEKFAEKLIGSGAFYLESIDNATSNVILKRNDKYWGEKSELSKITMRLIPESSTRIVALENKEADFYNAYSSDYNVLSQNKNLKIEEFPSFNFSYLMFNTEQEPCSNQLFRKAIAYAIDYESVNMIATGGNGSFVNSVFYKDAFGFVPEGVEKYSYDPEKAKDLLKEAGISVPYDLGVVHTIGAQKSTVEVIQQNLKQVGINIQIEQVEAATYIGNLFSGNFKISYMPSSGLGNTPVSVLKNTFTTEAIGGYNFSRYSNSEFDALVSKMASRKNSDELGTDIQTAMKIIQDDIPFLNLYHKNEIAAFNKNLIIYPTVMGVYKFSKFKWQ